MTAAFVGNSIRPGNTLRCFESSHYASSFGQKLVRAIQLGPKYYFWDVPRYFCNRASLGLPFFDPVALINPLREFRQPPVQDLAIPPNYGTALDQLDAAGVRLSMPRPRIEALIGTWWAARRTKGDVVECGAYRGATSLLIALLGSMSNLQQTVWMFDTFQGMPETSDFDPSRSAGEFASPANQVEQIHDQARLLGISDRIRVCPGRFADSFKTLVDSPMQFAFAHIDANLFQSTWEACEFVVPRMRAGGALVFDDYNGVCDLGARLAIDKYFANTRLRLRPLVASSASLLIEAPTDG